ncbi:ketoacyl-ACP synthase III [Pseudoalteromonas sp. SSMSWG5]|uniref:ketoacyl-ACP synthase III n=1 Tax=Pseudoalteromonas sp. SSMSWG5 TaxID=3139396 RepID=UPI003BAAD65A
MIYIKEIGTYIPKQKINNYTNAERFSETKEFVDSKIGSEELPQIAENENTSDMVVKAVEALLEKSQLGKNEIEALVVVTQNADFGGLPHCSAIAHGKLLLKPNVSCFDISLGCSGYVYGLSILKAHMIEMGFKNAILVTADPYSKIINREDRVTSLLFGDAATATLLSTEGVFSIERPLLNTEGSGGEALVKKEHLFMNGRQVFNFAATKVPAHITEYLTQYSLNKEDIDAFILHQGSASIVEVISRKLGLESKKAPLDIRKTGNTVSSSIPILLERYIHDKEGNNIIISGFGVGLSWATNLLRRKTC